MSGILYAIMAVLALTVLALTAALRKASQKASKRERVLLSLKERSRGLYLDWLALDKTARKDEDVLKMYLRAKDQRIAEVREETEREMRDNFLELTERLYSEIDRLCEERSSLQRTINLQGGQLEKLEDDLKLSKMVMTDTLNDFIALDRLAKLQVAQPKGLAEESELSGISINGVPMSHAELAEAQSNNDQSEYPMGPYGLHDLSDLEVWDDLYEREVPSHKKGLWRGEEKLHSKVDNTRQSSYRQVTISLREARKLVELQRAENQKVAKSEEDLARTRDIKERLAVIQEQIDATPEGPAGQVALKDLYRRKEGLFWQLGQIEIRYYEGGE